MTVAWPAYLRLIDSLHSWLTRTLIEIVTNPAQHIIEVQIRLLAQLLVDCALY